MPAIAEEVKRATEMEAGDLAIEVVGKMVRVYEITGGSKLRQIAYSDAFQGHRFLFMHEPTEEMVPAKDFTTARLYRKPENARKLVAKYFPKYARGGAKAHLYYSGAGPRGRSLASGEGYFSVPLGGPGEGIDEVGEKCRYTGKLRLSGNEAHMKKRCTCPECGRVWAVGAARGKGKLRCYTDPKSNRPYVRIPKHKSQASEGLDELKGIPKPKKFIPNKNSREFKMGQRAFEQNKPNAPALNKKLMLSFKGKTSDQMMQMMTDYAAGWHAANLAAPVPERREGPFNTLWDRQQAMLDEAEIALRAGTPLEVTLTVERGQITAIKERGKTVPVSDQARQRIRSVHKAAALGLRGADRKVWDSIKWPTNFSDIGAGQPFEHKGKRYVKLFKGGARKSEVLSVETRKVVNLGFTGEVLVKVIKRVTIGEDNYWNLVGLGFKYLQESLDEVKVTIVPGSGGYRLMVRRVYPRGIPEAWWWTGIKWSKSTNSAVWYDQKQGAQVALRNAKAAWPMESDMNERYDPQAARDYVTRIKDRKRKAYAREYLKAIKGIRMPPSPEEFKITTQAAREVELGFKKIGAPLAASVQRSDPTFEQIARIVRRAKSGGFNPSRISLAERAIPTTDAEYLFLIHHETDDSYSVAHSVHGDPRLGYQELQTGLDKRAAEKMVRKLKTRWKKAKVRRLLLTGHGHKREWLPESDAEKAKRIKTDVDGEINDPKNKGLTIAQTLLAMFGMDVDEAVPSAAEIKKAQAALIKKLKGRWQQMSKKQRELFGTEFVRKILPKVSEKLANSIALSALRVLVKEDADEARKRVVISKLKDEVNYRRSKEDVDGDERCGNCAFISLPDACQRVRGKIDQDFICDLFKRGVAEGLDEAGTQGKVQKALLDFVRKLPPNNEFWLSDVMKRQEFRRVHFKRLMSAAKALEKKGLIWYDGMSAVGPVK